MANSGEIEPRFLSASTNGRQIKVAATGTPGTLIHTAVAGTDDVDHITIEANNVSTASGEDQVRLTIEFGGTTSPDDHIVIDVTAGRALAVVVTRRALNNGLAVRAFADFADAIVIGGDVRRVTL